MAKVSAVARNNKRKRLTKSYSAKRAKLKAIIMDKSAAPEERMAAQFALQKCPKNSAKIRIRNRCEISGRPRAYYRQFGMSRIALRDLGSTGYLPGVVKSSW